MPLSDEPQPPTPETEPTATETPKPRKPGFFSRLFTAHDVAPPPEEGPAAVEVDMAEQAEEEVSPFAAGPEGFNAQPQLEEAAEPEKRRGLFSRMFARREEPKAPAPHEPAENETQAQEESIPAEAPAPGAAQAAPVTEHRKSWFQRLRERLRRGSGSFIAAIRSAIGLSGRLDDDTIEQLEDILVASDVSMETTMKIVERMRRRAKAEKIEGADAIMEVFKETVREVFAGNAKVFEPARTEGPYVVMVVGVNGVGKTTTIGKMAKRVREAGLSVMLVAGDTFRAAAVEQLEEWARRTGCEFLRGRQDADPSGLAFDALKAAQQKGVDVVFIDTAGRLHTKTSLMEELGKIRRVCSKVIPGTPHETLLVLDATTGQNAVQQVKLFSEAAGVTGLVMTKLDGTAKGGILITLRDQFDIPITLVGVGEGVDDLRDFDPEQFTAALFEEDRQPA